MDGGATMLSTLSSSLSTFTSGVGSIATMIVDNDLLFLGVEFFFAGGLIGLLGRALRRG